MISKVLQVSYLNPMTNYGGVEKYILNLAKSLRINYGVTVDILCADNVPSISKSNFGRVISLKVPFFSNKSLFFISKYLYGRLSRNYINSHFSEYDAIHFHGDNGLIGNLWSKKSILTLHGIAKNKSTILNRIISFLPAFIERNNVKKARSVFSVSNEAREFFKKYNEEIHMIKQSVDTSLYHNISEAEKKTARKILKIDDDIIMGTIVGRDPKRKGLKIAIEAVRAVENPKLRLYAIGFPKLESGNNSVIFPGDVDENTKLYYLASSDFFIFPSVKEGFPISVLEAALCGLPLIVSKQSGVSELTELVPFFREIESFYPRNYARALKDLITLLSNNEFDKVTNDVNRIEQYSVLESTRKYVESYKNLK